MLHQVIAKPSDWTALAPARAVLDEIEYNAAHNLDGSNPICATHRRSYAQTTDEWRSYDDAHPLVANLKLIRETFYETLAMMGLDTTPALSSIDDAIHARRTAGLAELARVEREMALLAVAGFHADDAEEIARRGHTERELEMAK